MSKNTQSKIEEMLAVIRVSLQADGGDIELVEWDEKKGELKVRLLGRCAFCPMSQFTFENAVKAEIKTNLSEVKDVILVA